MALVTCGDCGNQVSDQAAACPKCGAPASAFTRPPNAVRGRAWLALFGIILVLAIASPIISTIKAKIENRSQLQEIRKRQADNQAAAEKQSSDRKEEWQRRRNGLYVDARRAIRRGEPKAAVDLLTPWVAELETDGKALLAEANQKFGEARQLEADNAEKIRKAERAALLAKNPPDSQGSPPQPPAPAVPDLEWFQGGTLHRATVAQWRAGSERDRIATAADFTSTILQGKASSMGDLRIRTFGLMTCIKTSIEGRQAQVERMSVSEISALCAVSMGWHGG